MKLRVLAYIAMVMCLVVFLAPSRVSAQSPSVAVGISAAGVYTIANNVLPSVMDAIRTGEFPGESGTESGYKYDISNIRLTRLFYEDLVMQMTPEGIRAGIHKLTVALSLKWSYKKKKLPYLPRGSGSADVSMTGCSIAGTFRFHKQMVNGRPGLMVTVVNPVATLDNISIKTHGSLFSWLYNLIIRLFRNTIRKSIETGITQGFAVAVNARAAQILSTMELIKPISSWGVIDLGVLDPIYYNGGAGPAWSFAFNGEVYPSITRTPLNIVPRVHMPWTSVGRHFELNFSFFTINTAGAVWQRMRNFNAQIDNNSRPPGFPIALTANAWQPHLPQVQSKYPASPIEIRTALETFPVAGTNGNQMVLSMGYLIYVTANGRPAFTLRAKASGAAVINVRSNAIVPRIDDVTVTFTVVDSAIGAFNLKPAEFIFNAVIKLVALPAINAELFAGFPLPTVAGLHFVNPQFNVRDGYIAAGFDVVYQP